MFWSLTTKRSFMKYLYSFSLLLGVTLLLTSCTKKSWLRPYDDRIEGTWEITDIYKTGFGNSDLAFDGGLFTFYASGQLGYQDGYGGYYDGNWDIRSINTGDGVIKTLKVYCADDHSGDVLGEFFDEIVFTGTNRFEAYIYDGPRTYTYKFARR